MLSIDDRRPWPPCPAPFNLAAHVLAAGEAQPDKVALAILKPSGAERWSFGRLVAAVRGAGTGLLQIGLQPGDRVLMRLGNEPAFPVAYLGAVAAGLVPVPTNAQLTAEEATKLAARIAPRLIIAGPGVALPDPLPCPVLPAADLLAMEALPPCAWNMGDPDRLAYVVFTSGTSGSPMAVSHAHRAIWARGMMRVGWEGFASTDRVLHAGALNWTYTLGTGLLDPWTVGATALVPAAGTAPAQLPLLAKRFDATVMAAVPGVYRQMLRAPMPALPKLKHALSAGEKLTPALRSAWQAATGTDLHEAVGMSEVSTYLSGSDARPAPPGAAGYAQPGRCLAVLGPDGQAVPRGQEGVLAVDRRDPGLMLGYLDEPEATAARVSGDWFLTGDRAVMAPDGAITTLGRNDDLMNAGGFRVAPAEIEAVLAHLPGLAEVAVAEVPVASGATVIAAFCVSAGPLEPEALDAQVSVHLARWKVPRMWVRVDHLPHGPNGKLDRKALPALAPRTS